MNDAGSRGVLSELAEDVLFDPEAQAYTGVKEKSALVREALKALIQREAAKRLIMLGESQPGIQAAPRRRQAVG